MSLSFGKTFIVGAVALAACRSDSTNTRRDLRSTQPASISKADAYAPDDARRDTSVRYADTSSTGRDWRSTDAESFSTSEPYGAGDARICTATAHEHRTLAGHENTTLAGDDRRGTGAESFSTAELYGVGDARMSTATAREHRKSAGHEHTTLVGNDQRGTDAESFSTAEPYGVGEARMSTAIVHEHGTSAATLADNDVRGTDAESFSTSAPYVAGDTRVREASAPRDSRATTDGTRPLTSPERDFIIQALNCGMFEVQSSQLAIQKGVLGKHREFAEEMVAHHGKMNRELERLAQERRLTAPLQLDSKHDTVLDELRELERDAFTQRYHDVQVKGHEDAIRHFERAARECQDPELKAFVQRGLPTLRQHLQLLTETESPRHDVESSDDDSQ